MKNVLTSLALVALNLGLIYISLLFHTTFSVPIIKMTDAPIDFEMNIFIPVFLISIGLLFLHGRFRRFGIGITALLISLIISLVFNLNKSLARKGNYENFALEEAHWNDEGFFVKIRFNLWHNSIEVSQEKCIKVDSIQVRVNNGLFGMRILTDDVIIDKKTNCNNINDVNDKTEDHLTVGHQFAHIRCFSESIIHYTKNINKDSLNPKSYYFRGLAFMATEKYEYALQDFIIAGILEYSLLDVDKIEFIRKLDLQSYSQELTSHIKAKNFKDLAVQIENISIINDFDTYQKRINFCLQKLDEK